MRKPTTKEDISNIAQGDPRLALALLMTSPRRETMQSVTLLFATAAANQTVGGFANGQFQKNLCDDVYMYDRSYQIRTPLRPVTATSARDKIDYALNSDIDIQIQYQNCPEYNISPLNLPVEMMGHRLAGLTTPDAGMNGFLMPFNSNVVVTAVNTRALTAAETPTIVIMCWFGLVLACRTQQWSSAEAADILQNKFGIPCGGDYDSKDRGNPFLGSWKTWSQERRCSKSPAEIAGPSSIQRTDWIQICSALEALLSLVTRSQATSRSLPLRVQHQTPGI